MTTNMDRYITYFRNFKKYSYLLTILVKRDIKKKYKGSTLGILWSLLNPLLQMTVLTIIFSTLFHNEIRNFPLYMIAGRLFFDFFSSGTNTAMRSIYGSANLLTKVYLPKYIMTLSRVIANFLIFCISLLDLLLVMIFTGAEFTIHLVYVPLYLILLLLFTSGVSLILATLATFFRDIEHLYGVFTMMLMHFSALFYPANIIPAKYHFLLQLNLLYYYISGFRQIVYNGGSPDFINLISCLIIAIISFVIGLIVFEKNQDKFIFYI